MHLPPKAQDISAGQRSDRRVHPLLQPRAPPDKDWPGSALASPGQSLIRLFYPLQASFLYCPHNMGRFKRCVSMAFFFSCGCLWQNPVFIVEESEKMNSKHRKRVPTSVFCLPCSAAASAKLLVGKCPKPSEWKGASKHGRTKKNSTNQVQSN